MGEIKVRTKGARRSLAEGLPYKSTRTVPTRQQWPLSVLILKDGTMATAFRLSERDTFAMSMNERNALAGCLEDALHVLPPHVFLQIVFETGDDYDELIDAFASRSDPSSHPILKRSRQIRAEAARRASKGKRPRITYWLGWRGALCKDTRVLRRFRRSFQREPDKHDIQNAGQALADISEDFMERLAMMGLTGEPLSEADIAADLHRAVNPNRYKHTPPPFSDVLPEELHDVTTHQPMCLDRRNLSSRLAAGNIKFSDSALRFLDPELLQRVMGITQYPSATKFGWLDPLFYKRAPKTPCRVTITHLATDKTLAAEALGQQQKRLFGHVGERYYPPEDLVAAAKSHMQVVQALGHTNARVFHTSIQVVVSGSDPHELEQASRRVAAAFQESRAQIATRDREQLQAWQASLPGNGHVLWREALNKTYQLLSRNAAHTTPMWVPPTRASDPDLLMQTRQDTLRGFNICLKEGREDASGVVIGKTGSGKTFLKLLLQKLGVLDRGGHAIWGDSKGPEKSSLKPICDVVEGDYKCLDSAVSCSFNPCPTFEEVFADGRFEPKRVLELRHMLCMMGMPHWETNPDYNFFADVAQSVIAATYEERRRDATRNIMLEDIVARFDAYRASAEIETLRDVAGNMRERLLMWCRLEDKARLINRPDAMDTQNRLTVFDFSGVEKDKELHNVLMASLATRIEYKLSQLPFDLPKSIWLDEAKILFGKSPTAQLLAENWFRAGRATGAAAYLSTQHHLDVLESPGIKSNISMLFLMRHASDHDRVAEAFDLTSRETALFRSLQFRSGHFAECLVKDVNQNRTEVLRYSPTAFDLWTDTSRPADIEWRKRYMREHGCSLLEAVEALARNHPTGAPKSRAEQREDFYENADDSVGVEVQAA